MAVWAQNNFTLTKKGYELLARVQVDMDNLEITRVMIGEGRVQNDPAAISALEDVVMPVRECEIVGKDASETGSVLNVQLTNIGVTRAFFINQIGVYAKIEGAADSTEILYMVAQSDEPPDEMYLPSVIPISVKYALNILHSRMTSLIVTVNPAGLASITYVNELIYNVQSNLEALITDLKADEFIYGRVLRVQYSQVGGIDGIRCVDKYGILHEKWILCNGLNGTPNLQNRYDGLLSDSFLGANPTTQFRDYLYFMYIGDEDGSGGTPPPPQEFTFVSVTQSVGGKVSINGLQSTFYTFVKGSNMTVSFVPDEGYALTQLKVDGVAKTVPFTMAAGADIVITYTTSAQQRTVTLTQPSAGGTLSINGNTSSSQQYPYDAQVTITLTPADTYSGAGIIVGGVVQNTNSYPLVIKNNIAISGLVTKNKQTVTITANSFNNFYINGTLIVGSVQVDQGSNVRVQVTQKSAKTLFGSLVVNGTTYTTADVTVNNIRANWTVSATYIDNDAVVTVTGARYVYSGSNWGELKATLISGTLIEQAGEFTGVTGGASKTGTLTKGSQVEFILGNSGYATSVIIYRATLSISGSYTLVSGSTTLNNNSKCRITVDDNTTVAVSGWSYTWVCDCDCDYSCDSCNSCDCDGGG